METWHIQYISLGQVRVRVTKRLLKEQRAAQYQKQILTHTAQLSKNILILKQTRFWQMVVQLKEAV